MRKTTVTLASAAAASVIISGAGVAAASPRPAASGTEVFHLMTTSATARQLSLIATGVFTAGGVDISGSTTDTVKFANGTFKINHPGKGTGTHSLNPKTCLFTSNATGKYTVSDGTGAYAGISGSGTAKISFLGIAARNSAGKCSTSLKPVSAQETIIGTGHVSL